MREPRRDQVAQLMEQRRESGKEDDGEYWEHGETAAEPSEPSNPLTSVVPVSRVHFLRNSVSNRSLVTKFVRPQPPKTVAHARG